MLENKKNLAIKIICSLLLIVAITFYFFSSVYSLAGNPIEKISIAEKVTLKIEKVNSVEKRYLGLSGRRNLCSFCGMLFLMPQKEVYYFSMRKMKFDLDFIWINNNEIVKIDKNIQLDFSGTISSVDLVDKVLEVPAGLADNFNIKIGDKVDF